MHNYEMLIDRLRSIAVKGEAQMVDCRTLHRAADAMENQERVIQELRKIVEKQGGMTQTAADLALQRDDTLAKLQEAERTVVQLRKQWQEAELFICEHCQQFDWEKVNGLIFGNKKCNNLTGVPFCDEFVSRDKVELEQTKKLLEMARGERDAVTKRMIQLEQELAVIETGMPEKGIKE